MRRWSAVLLLPGTLLGCTADVQPPQAPTATSAGPAVTEPGQEQRFPDIVAARLIPTGDGTFDVEVTVSSPYDTPQRYADGWRVLAPDGTVLGTHDLAHDHAGEQPFTRVQRALTIPGGVTEVTIEGRDRANGFGGATLVVPVPPA